MGDILLLYSHTYTWRKAKCVPLSQKTKLFSIFSNYYPDYCHTVVVAVDIIVKNI